MQILRNQQGITLLEVVMAMVIVSLLLMPLTNMLISGQQQAAAGHNGLQAAALAQGIMETVRAGHQVEWERIKPAEGWSYRQETTIVEFDQQAGEFVASEAGNFVKVIVTVCYPQTDRTEKVTLEMIKER